MAHKTFETALFEFKDAIRAAITRVGLDQTQFDEFTELFAADFAHVLGGPHGVAIWRRDRTNLVNLGRYLGTIAEMYAVTGDKKTVGTDELMHALQIISPVCQLGLPAGATLQRLCYCNHVAAI
jgi:hypothetical protein